MLGGTLFLMAYLQWAAPFFLRSLPPAALTPHADFWTMPVYWVAIAGLILGSFIDLDHFYLPDRVTIGGMVLGVPFSFFVPELQGIVNEGGASAGWGANVSALCWSLGGLAFGFLFLWGIGWFFSKLFKKDAMGFGDVKLLGAVGAFFGPWAVLFTIVVSSFVGSLVGGVLILRGKAKLGGYTAVPYGPFIALGVLAWMFWGPSVITWYLGLNAAGG
jgi:leader peptidase (prepilin peptidase)/N-methyltransferase